MKNVLLISTGILEINRMRRYFDTSFAIKATSSVQSAAELAAVSDAGLVMYSIGADLWNLFNFYRELRLSKKTENLPLIIIADTGILKPLSDCVELIGTKFIGHAISRENARKLIYEQFGETPPEVMAIPHGSGVQSTQSDFSSD
ncbi:MAG: hypothetical protein LBR74_01615 [Eubacterium sp.]|jgi:hypothetical protein|nr:hypothetical protein [Eubacterium sp.]